MCILCHRSAPLQTHTSQYFVNIIMWSTTFHVLEKCKFPFFFVPLISILNNKQTFATQRFASSPLLPSRKELFFILWFGPNLCVPYTLSILAATISGSWWSILPHSTTLEMKQALLRNIPFLTKVSLTFVSFPRNAPSPKTSCTRKYLTRRVSPSCIRCDPSFSSPWTLHFPLLFSLQRIASLTQSSSTPFCILLSSLSHSYTYPFFSKCTCKNTFYSRSNAQTVLTLIQRVD